MLKFSKIPDRAYLLVGSLIILLVIAIFSCERLDLIKLVRVKTVSISDTARTSCVAHGKIIDLGEEGISEHGYCWLTTNKPTISNFKTVLGERDQVGDFTDTLKGLSANTKYYVKAYAIDNEGKPTYGSEISFTTKPPIMATLTTSAVTKVGSDSAVCGGNITSDGDAPVTDRGVCWNTTQNPTLTQSLNHTNNGTGTGSFESIITGLNSNTNYFVCAYATNSAGTSYGNDRTFKTSPGIPTLTTSEATLVTSSSAISGGNITNDGGATVTDRGVCWSTVHFPTAEDEHTSNGTGSGSFFCNLTGLNPVTNYYVRAYATNNYGTAYGNEITFKTNALLPTLTTSSVLSITSISAVSGGNVISDGGAPVIVRGVCWSTELIPTVTDTHTEDGSGKGSYASSMTGLNSNTTYHVRAYATNSAGTGYGDTLSFTTKPGLPTLVTSEITSITETNAVSGGTITNDGGAPVTARGVCWNTAGSPLISDFSTNDGSGTGTFISNLTGLKNKTKYYIRAYATNSSGTQYGNELNFTTVSLPTVITFSVSNVTSNSATSGGNVTNDGGTPVTARGVCWNTSGNPSINNEYTINGSGIGTFNSSIVELESNTTYYLRAYATNSSGTGYGTQQSFKTNATVTDIDGNIYNTVQIGTQLWMSENLKVTHYNDGSSIPNASDNGVWTSLSSGAFCSYNNEENNVIVYGRLYNFFAVNDAHKLCPIGWHVPSDDEWTVMTTYLGGINIAGGKMKETGITHWSNPNAGATNESGFTALPGGYRSYYWGTFNDMGNLCGFWSSTIDVNNVNVWSRILEYNNVSIRRDYSYTTDGFYVRCILGENPISRPTLTTSEVTSIKAYTASSGGNITSDGNSPIVASGVCWNTTGSPTLSDNYTTDGSGIGIFVSNITGLSPLTTYYVRAYTTNSMGTAYGNEINFNTDSDAPPTTPINVVATPGDGEINITWDQVSRATTYVIYWSNSPDVSKTNFTGKITNITTTSYLHSGLTKGTAYYYVITAKNDYGESDESIVVKTIPPLIYETRHMSNLGQKEYHQVTVTEGQNLFVNITLTDNGDDFYLYIKYGSLPTTEDYDTISNTGEDETINITNTKAGTYYIMVYVALYDTYPYCSHNYTITVSNCVTPLILSGPQMEGHISHFGEKHYYEVSVSSGQNFFVNISLTDGGDNFYLYAKYGSLPTRFDYDYKSETGEDEAISVINSQSGIYYIMIYAAAYDTYPYCTHNYTITAFTSK